MGAKMRIPLVGVICCFLLASSSLAADFRFESFPALDRMQTELRRLAPLGAPREVMRARFVEEGGAKLHGHPSRTNAEKYVYDIGLCGLYVWRWNISANFDGKDRLTQIFVNGEPVHADGDASRLPAKKPGAEESIARSFRLRPEASRGESKIAYLVYDLDVATDDIDDEFVAGTGPSRADPNDFGFMHAYENIERWRSIFDDEPAASVMPYAGGCP